MLSAAQLDDLMHRGWPGLTNIPVDGWVVRLAGGVTSRANSVLPVDCPRNLEAAMQQVEALYREHGIAPTFQISPTAQPGSLDALLDERGYSLRSPTLVQTAGLDLVLRRLAPSGFEIAIEDEPDETWMDLWWSVDGRGGPEASAIARRILVSCPALYASMYDGDDVTAAGRLALVDDWGGIYCMAVRADARRRGHGNAILRTLLEEGAEHNIRHAWLQVLEGNHGARTLYERAGFVTASRYHYRVLTSAE